CELQPRQRGVAGGRVLHHGLESLPCLFALALLGELHRRLVAGACLLSCGDRARIPPLVAADAGDDQDRERDDIDAIAVPELRHLLAAYLALELAQNRIAVVSHSRFGPPDALALDTFRYPGAVHIAQRTCHANATACRHGRSSEE